MSRWSPMSASADPVRIGLVGGGPWARLFHAPMFAASPETILAGVWSRRSAARDEIAVAHGTTGFETFGEMVEQVDALCFAVPPDIQAELAMIGARAGKALLLEKPLALDLDRATELTEAIDQTGVPSQMVLTWRYTETVRSFLRAVHGCEPLGGRGFFLSGGLLGGMFATPWRIDRGPLWDLGPHVLDLLDAALGPIVDLRGHGEPHRWVDLQLTHASGIVSSASVTAYSRLDPSRAGAEIYHPAGVHEVDASGVAVEAVATIASEFADIVRTNRPHLLDAHRGLYLQGLLASAARDLE